MIIDIIVILKLYLIFYTIDIGVVKIGYSCSNTETLYRVSHAIAYNIDTIYTTRIHYILLMNQSDKLKLNYL